MYPGHRPGSGRRAAHLASPRHVCPLQGGHEPGAGLSGETRPTVWRNSSDVFLTSIRYRDTVQLLVSDSDTKRYRNLSIAHDVVSYKCAFLLAASHH